MTTQCTVLAAAVIGSFSWTTIEEAYWLTHGFWHSSLIFSVLGILLSASEVTVLHLLGPLPHTGQFKRDVKTAEKYYPLMLSPKQEPGKYASRTKMVFTWQAPLMFMSYSVCAFLVGLTVLVCTPLIREGHHWTIGHNVSNQTYIRASVLSIQDRNYVLDGLCRGRYHICLLLFLGLPLREIGSGRGRYRQLRQCR